MGLYSVPDFCISQVVLGLLVTLPCLLALGGMLFANWSTCFFSISLGSADGPREGGSEEDYQLHISTLSSLFLLNLQWDF